MQRLKDSPQPPHTLTTCLHQKKTHGWPFCNFPPTSQSHPRRFFFYHQLQGNTSKKIIRILNVGVIGNPAPGLLGEESGCYSVFGSWLMQTGGTSPFPGHSFTCGWGPGTFRGARAQPQPASARGAAGAPRFSHSHSPRPRAPPGSPQFSPPKLRPTAA